MKPLYRLVIITLMFGSVSSTAIGAANGDCTANSVIYCGVDNQTDIMNAMQAGDGRHSAADITQIYAANGVQADQLSQTEEGTVTKDGRVMLANGQVVATGAQSVGRDFLAGSSKQGNVYIRPTSVSFRQSSLAAFIYRKDGQFAWAIIKSCGNPVVAKPVIAVTTGSTPPPPVYTPPPTPTPTPPPVYTAPPPPPPVPLPKSGAADILGGAIGFCLILFAQRLHRNSRTQLKQALLREHWASEPNESFEL